MTRSTSPAGRSVIAATVDSALLDAVDARIREQPGFDRDAVIDEAPRLWLAHAQQEAMEAQLALSPRVTMPSQARPEAVRAPKTACAGRTYVLR